MDVSTTPAAALYGPLLGVPGSPYAPPPGEVVPPAIAELRASLLARPAGQWVLRRYQEDRPRVARGFGTRAEGATG